MNNVLILDLFEHKSEGIFALLEDECKKRAISSLNLINTIVGTCSRKKMFSLPKVKSSDFIIQHFAEHVRYSTVKLEVISDREIIQIILEFYRFLFKEHFVEKNTEVSSTDVFTMVKQCTGGESCGSLNHSKSAVSILQNDLTALMTTLKKNVNYYHTIFLRLH